MRLSIWRQFSSNHSARFELVGVFSSAAEAAEAGQNLTEMLRAIFDWFEENREKVPRDQEYRPSPVEQDIAGRLGIKWPDWTIASSLFFDENGQGPIQVTENLVVIDGTNSDGGAKPLDEIVKRLGGHPFVSGTAEIINLTPGEQYPSELEIRPEVHFNLVCRLPDEPSAADLAMTLRGFPRLHARQIEALGTEVRIIDSTMYPMFNGLARLFSFLKEHGAALVECTFVETRSKKTWITFPSKPASPTQDSEP